MQKIFNRNFVVFIVLLCVAMGVFLARETPQYAPFVLESSAIFSLGGGQNKHIILPNATKSAHSSSIVDLGKNLMVVYFAGSREGASDVKIMQHFIDKESLESSPQRAILDAKMLSNFSGKFIKKLGNPVIFKDKNGAIHLFVVGVSLGGWATSKIYQLKFAPNLQDLEFKDELHLGLLANFSHLVRTPPILLENGGFMLPFYHELARKYALVGFFDKNAKLSHTLRINRLKNQLQPTIIALNAHECLAFFRNHKAYKNTSFLQECSESGAIWKKPKITNLKGYDDSALLVSYTNAKNVPRILLIYNDGFTFNANTRASLSLYFLNFSANQTLDINANRAQNANCTQNEAKFTFLENIDLVEKQNQNEVSYPSAIISDGYLFVAYTHNRKNIKITRFNLAHLEAQIARISLDANPKNANL